MLFVSDAQIKVRLSIMNEFLRLVGIVFVGLLVLSLVLHLMPIVFSLIFKLIFSAILIGGIVWGVNWLRRARN